MAIELYSTPTFNSSSRYWGIVLAGGEGKRLRSFIKSQFGKDCPKQFCAIVGNRSMFQHTINRARLLISDNHLLTVISHKHLHHAYDDIKERNPETVIVIPFDRETAPSMLLPLLTIYKNDSKATVAIFPSDHFVLHEDLFMEHIAAACEFVESAKDQIVLLGMTPDKVQQGYGWVNKGKKVHHSASSGKSAELSIYKVQEFLEKPADVMAQRIFSKGWLVNTMVLVGKAEKFMKLFERYTPELYSKFCRISKSLGSQNETQTIWEVFESIQAVNFSQAILEQISNQLCIMPLNKVYWNDWGEVERILEDLEQFNNFEKKEEDVKERNYTIDLSTP